MTNPDTIASELRDAIAGIQCTNMLIGCEPAHILALLDDRDRLKAEVERLKDNCKSTSDSIKGDRHAFFCTSQLSGCECNCGMALVARAEAAESELAALKGGA